MPSRLLIPLRLVPLLVAMYSGAPIGVLHELHAQTPGTEPAFEVTSIKPNRSGETARSFRIEPGGDVRATNVTVRHLMWQAYSVQDFQITGGPGWIATDRYDVLAKARDTPTPERLRAMLRRLLADRFRLEAEETTRDAPVFLLVRGENGKLGPQLRPATGECAQPEARGCGANVGDGTLVSKGLTMSRLAGELTGFVDRRVHDRTGLTGPFEIDLTWSPDVRSDDGRASIFTAIQEQLGLKLESSVGPLRVVIVKRVERPTAD